MTPTLPNRDGVALRAYFIWTDEGRPHGRHDAHWFAAEAAEIGAAAPIETAIPVVAPVVKKVSAPRKPAAAKVAAAKASAPAKTAAPKAAAETVVAAAALAAPRAARTTAKGARRAH